MSCPGLSSWALNPMTSVRPPKRKAWGDLRQMGKGHVKTGRDWSDAPRAKEAWSHRKLEDARKDPPVEPLRAHGPAGTLILDF